MYDKPITTSQLLLFADPPNLNELCVVTAKISKQILQQSSAVQPHILKCREIIFTEPSIIATPAYDVNNALHVVMEQSLFKTGRLQARFQKIGLEISKPTMVSHAMYQSCLRYTLVARIAPNWNKTGEWLIQGRDFLTSNGYVNAVKLDITVNQGEMYFALDATTVKFLPLQVEDLDIYEKCYKEFMENPHAEINECAIGSPWSHVLPSMKKGKVVGVTRTLPQSGPFKSYKDLKRHWKNNYGYRLPESEEGVIYYQVHFRPLGGRIFTYPEVCLRASEIQRVPRVDPKPILTAFLQGLQSKMSSVCGSPLRLQSKAKYPILELVPPNLQVSNQAANLSNRSSSGKIIYRSKEEMEIMLNKTQNAPKGAQIQTDQTRHFDSQCTPVHKEDNDRIFLSKNERNQPRDVIVTNKSQSGIGQHGEIMSATGSNIALSGNPSALGTKQPNPSFGKNPSQLTPIPASRIVPTFTPKICPSNKKSIVNGLSTTCSPKTVPMFKPKKIGTNNVPLHFPSTGPRPDSQNQLKQPLVGISCLTKETLTAGGDNRSSFSETAKIRSVAPSFKPRPPSVPCGMGDFTRQSSKQKAPSKDLMSSSMRINSYNTSSGTLRETPTTPQSPVLPVPLTPKVHQSTPKGTPTTVSKKRTKQDEEGTPKPKKPRTKPQIQDNFDVELFARGNQLQKANAATLIAWLKDKGIQHKSKDKKLDLIERVNHVLGLTAEP